MHEDTKYIGAVFLGVGAFSASLLYNWVNRAPKWANLPRTIIFTGIMSYLGFFIKDQTEKRASRRDAAIEIASYPGKTQAQKTAKRKGEESGRRRCDIDADRI